MTEVASLLPADHRLTSVRRYEAGPPEGLELVEPGETFATTKEEEWVSKKKTEVTNTKQIETRVKRQVVLEDGKVVDDSGPMVTTNTTEDTETQEHHQTELRKLGDQDDGSRAITEDTPDGSSKWVSVPNPDGVVREVKEKKVLSREETEEIKEVEDVQHYGDITDEAFLAAVGTGRQDIRSVLRTVSKDGQAVVSTGPRLVHESSRSKKTTDTEDVRALSSVLPDGKIVTESKRTTEHEEVCDDELPEDAPERDFYKESSQRYKQTRDQAEVDYLADGVNVGHAMKYRTETMEVQKQGDERDEPDFDSLSARIRRRNNTRQQLRYRGAENGQSPLDRKDALTRRPLDFDQEEETRKVETSKWLEHHFGSESRSSSSIVDDEDPPPKTSFFNVTIKSQPVKPESPPPIPVKPYVTTVRSPVLESPPPAPRPGYVQSDYYHGISQWSERKRTFSPSPIPRREVSPVPSPVPDYRREKSPSPILKRESTPYQREPSPIQEYHAASPTPPQRKRVVERRQKESSFTASLMPNGGSGRPADPPPDYSPPSPEKKPSQKTRFAPEPPKGKSKNIIGQSIRKLVGKIRSASAERKAKQRAKRSPSPSYQKGHVIDNIQSESRQPVQRYYLGEDPFAGSIYGRENKYDGVKPARTSRKQSRTDETPRPIDQQRSHSTLGRFSKSSSRLSNTHHIPERNSQTLPRHLSRKNPPPPVPSSDLGHPKSSSTINVSFVNTVSHPPGPPKPARTFKANLARSHSLNVHSDNPPRMYTSTPHLNRLDRTPEGLKSPGLISSLSRSQRDVNYDDGTVRTRFAQRNGTETDNRRVFLKGLKDRAPELFKTLHEDEDGTAYRPSTTTHHRNKYNGDIYEPPTRLRDTQQTPQSILRRGSNSSTDYSETYHTTTRNDNPLRPSVTNTVKSFSKKTIPSKDGRGVETIESRETKSVTKSQLKPDRSDPTVKFYDTERTYSSGSPVVIEVRNRNYRK